MNSFFENWGPGSFDSSLWHLAGWTMCYFLVAGTAIGLAGTLLRFLCRRAAPTLRYAISLATFATLSLLPIAIAAWLIPTTLTTIDLQTPQIAPPSGWETPASPKQHTTLLPSPLVVESSHPEGGAIYAYSDDGAIVIVRQAIAHLPWLWIFGAPITFALLATGLVGSTRMRRNSEPITTGVLADSCNRLRKSLNVTRRVSIALCDRIAQPVLVGIVRPLILLPPAALTGWSPDELEMVLLHELAHVRRWDNLVNLLQRIVESLLFFHPVVWLVSRQVRRDREECCDAVVVAHTAKPQAYAELLVNIAAATPPPLAGLALARHPLTQRIRRILKLEDEPMLVSRNALGSFTLAALTLVAVVLWQPTTTSIAEEQDASVAAKGITTEDTEGTEEEERTAESAGETKTKSQKQTFLGGIFGRKLRYSTTFTSPLFEEYRKKRGPREYEILQQTQFALIKSDFILKPVLQDKRIAKLPIFKEIPDPLDWLRNNLHVSFFEEAPLYMNIYLEASVENKEDLKTIVDLVIKRYDTEIIQKQKTLAESAKAAQPAIPVFLSLEQQRLVDLVRKTLDVELEQLGVEDLARVKASKFEGGLRLTTSTNDAGFATGDLLLKGDILVGLHVWPTKSLEDVAAILQRDDIAELSPLKFFVIRRQSTENRPGLAGGYGIDEVEMIDKLITGRVTVNVDAIKSKPQDKNQESVLTAPVFSPAPQDESRTLMPQKIAPGDQLMVRVEGEFPERQIDGAHLVEPAGTIALGPTYGRVEVSGKTLSEAEKSVTEHLNKILAEVSVQITWAFVKNNTAQNQPPETDKSALLYDGKTFDQWQQMWKTELKTEKRTECIKALAAFGRAGRAKEAAEAILDVAGEYFDSPVIDDSAEGKLKNSVIRLLQNLSTSSWFTPLLKRYDSDAKKWGHLTSWLLGGLHSQDEQVRQQLLNLANSDHGLRTVATRALLQNDLELKHPETVEVARKALQGEHPNMSVLNMLSYRHLDQVPEQFDMLLHEDPEIRKSARRVLVNNNRIQPLIDKLMEVLDDAAQSKKHVYAIRALPYANGNPKVVLFLIIIAGEGDEQLLGPALFSLTKVIGATVDTILPMIGKDALSEDRKKLLSDNEAMQKLVDQEKQFMEQDNYGAGSGFGGGGGGGGGFF
ncbi:MAG: M48 family metalloprotease [Planctomycetes bacterium]|nr:M48 family metalloprotease [Planctomycetota bacterium]